MNPISRALISLRLRVNKRRFKTGDYLQAYAENTNLKAKIDAGMAIGGLWEEMGRQQFEFLKARGLKPQHRLLDIGCGSLRGGLLFIDYMDVGCYTGFDLSTEVIEAGKRKVTEKGLDHKQPKLLENKDRNLKFAFLGDSRFDFILAQSVFSHLLPEHIEECFVHIGQVMAPEGKFSFTHHPGARFGRRSETDFEYPKSFFEELAKKHGFLLEDWSEEYRHPRGQNMLIVASAAAA